MTRYLTLIVVLLSAFLPGCMPLYLLCVPFCQVGPDTPWRDDPRVSEFVHSDLHAAVLDHDVEQLEWLLKTHSPDEEYRGITPLDLAAGLEFAGTEAQAPRSCADVACAVALLDAGARPAGPAPRS